MHYQEAIDRLRKWEKKETEINLLLLTHSQELQVKVSGRIRTDGDSFTLTYNTGCEVSIAPAEDMRFKYSDAILRLERRRGAAFCMSQEINSR